MQTIRWLNAAHELVNNTGQPQLVLSLENVKTTLNNTEYTCEVDVILATGLTTITENTSLIIGADSGAGDTSE